MKFSHFFAIVTMRWQMMRNRFGKAGTVNLFVTLFLMACAALCSLGSFVFVLGWGSFLLSRLDAFNVIFVWDVIVGIFLFGWAMALMVELQRSEMLSLKNLLHLPISLAGAFFLNYASSMVSLTLLFLLPGMVGLCAASVMTFGSKSLVAFALLASFLLMVTAISYQLRGWLARLMENKRTRGTVIAMSTVIFVMVCQIPNLINMGSMQSRWETTLEHEEKHENRLNELQQQMAARELSPEDYKTAVSKAEKEVTNQRNIHHQKEMANVKRVATVANTALPIGWLPLGACAAAQGAVVVPWLCVLGMSSIGMASLAMAYRSTIRAYTGDHNKAYREIAVSTVGNAGNETAPAKQSILEKNVPFLTETQSVIALGTFRSTLRAPEAKMALLTPLIFACIFGSMAITGELSKLPDIMRPWSGVAVLGLALLGMLQMMLNVFGLDRQGFRAFVLSPAPRRDILLGKNFGIFPIAATLSTVLIVFMGIVGKMHFTHIVATVLQFPIAFFLSCLVGNFTSIAGPVAMKVGTMKPVSMTFSVILIQFVAMFFISFAIIPAAVSLGAELLLREYAGVRGFPVYLLLTLIELPIALWFYSKMQTVQGRYLQDREHKILDTISKVVD